MTPTSTPRTFYFYELQTHWAGDQWRPVATYRTRREALTSHRGDGHRCRIVRVRLLADGRKA